MRWIKPDYCINKSLECPQCGMYLRHSEKCDILFEQGWLQPSIKTPDHGVEQQKTPVSQKEHY